VGVGTAVPVFCGFVPEKCSKGAFESVIDRQSHEQVVVAGLPARKACKRLRVFPRTAQSSILLRIPKGNLQCKKVQTAQSNPLTLNSPYIDLYLVTLQVVLPPQHSCIYLFANAQDGPFSVVEKFVELHAGGEMLRVGGAVAAGEEHVSGLLD